jgi:hypothetical protein
MALGAALAEALATLAAPRHRRRLTVLPLSRARWPELGKFFGKGLESDGAGWGRVEGWRVI